MTVDEFISWRGIEVRDAYHKKIIRLFYSYMWSVCGDIRALPHVLGGVLHIDTSLRTVETGCFNGISDGSIPPYENVDLYIRFDNDVRVYIYGSMRRAATRKLNENEHVLIVLAQKFHGKIQRQKSNHTYIT